MAIGINWADIWEDVWGEVWSDEEAVPDEAMVVLALLWRADNTPALAWSFDFPAVLSLSWSPGMSVRQNLECDAGAAVTVECAPLATEDVTGWTLRFRVLSRRSGEVLLTRTLGDGITLVSAAAGTFEVSLSATHTGTTLGEGDYRFDLWRTDAGSEARLAHGRLLIED